MKNTIKTIFTAAAAGILASCSGFLDINQNPNSPAEENMSADMIFPAAEMNLATGYGYFLRNVGGYFAQHYSQLSGTSNYLDYSQFNMSATRSSSTYSQLNTRCLNNLKIVRELASGEEDWGSYLAATVLRAFTYQVLVDCYESVPYTEAMDASNPTPAYDDGMTVYNGIIAELDEALSHVSGTEPVCTNFLFPDGTAEDWIRFANALKLKIFMRMHNVSGVDVSAQIDALVQNGNFPEEDIAWTDCWSDAQGQANPFYSEEFGPYFSPQRNVCLNLSLQGTMAAYNDPRLSVFFDANGEGNYTGAISGTNFAVSANSGHGADHWCRPAIRYNTPVYLISVAETEFLLAEYYAENSNSTAAQTHYQAAVDASFASAGVAGADAVYGSGAPYEWDGTSTDMARVIGIQKWIALSGTNNFEAWCELRRLKYPQFGTVPGSQFYNVQSGDYDVSAYVPGTLYTPISVNTALGSNTMLQRFPFAESSSSRNENVPEYKGDASPMFWAE